MPYGAGPKSRNEISVWRILGIVEIKTRTVLNAALHKTQHPSRREAENEQHINIMHRGERRLGTPWMLYFEGRWQQTSPLEAGGIDVVRTLGR
jgi:hypothetical protein